MKLSLLLVLALAALASAFPPFTALFPNGQASMRSDSGITCDHLGHEGCVPGAPRNPFGQDFDDNGRVWDRALCQKDSDGDGLTNGEELGDPCCNWTQDNDAPLRMADLSHPGDSSQTNTAPPCDVPSPSVTPPESATPSESADSDSGGGPPPASTQSTSPSASPSASETPATSPDDDDGVCFPAHATVQLEGGAVRRMDALQVGDRVHIGGGKYSDVFLFTHRVADVMHEFITIRAGTQQKLDVTLTLTKGHYLYVNGEMITAGAVKPGDALELDNGRSSPVLEVECGRFKGLYNPQTTHGDLIVDGVKVSTYTTSVKSEMAHSMLAPLRALYRWFGWSTSSLEKGATKIAAMLP